MGSARLQGKKLIGLEQQEPSPAQGLDNQAQSNVVHGAFERVRKARARQEQEQAAAAALSAAEKAAQEKTAALAASAGGGAAIDTNDQGSNTYIEGSPDQGDVDLSTSDTTLRRRGGYRRDSGLRI